MWWLVLITGSALLFTQIFDLGIGLILVALILLALRILKQRKEAVGTGKQRGKKCLRCGQSARAEAFVCHICSFEFPQKDIRHAQS